MKTNTIQLNNLVTVIANIEARAIRLQAMLQGAPISRVKIANATITAANIDDLAITTAKIEDGAITNAKISDLSADKVTAGTISADRIATDSITASKLSVSSLSAITANFGTLTAGSIDSLTITSSSIATSGGGNNVIIYGDTLDFNNSGSYIFRAYSSGGVFFKDQGIGFAEMGGTSLRAAFTLDGGSVLFASDNADLLLLQALDNDVYIGDSTSGETHFECTTFKINGSTKTAIVPTSSGYRALYCVESPEVWFFDIANSFDEIDPLFWEVTEGEYKTVTNAKGEIMVFRKRAGFDTIRFESKTKQQFDSNNHFWNTPNEKQ